jgi:hypothetical protein
MKTFDLPAGARLKLVKTTPRKEHHGKDLRQAVSLRLRWETNNADLLLLHPNLKDALFWLPPEAAGQEQLPDLPQVQPFLRVSSLVMPLKLNLAFTGYTLSIEYGIADTTDLELYVCDLSKFTVEGFEGGTVAVEWSLASNKEVTPELVGLLCGLEGSEIVATQTPPSIATGDAIDGTQAAFDRDHPGVAAGAEEEREPGDLFAEMHGGENPDDDGPIGEGAGAEEGDGSGECEEAAEGAES